MKSRKPIVSAAAVSVFAFVILAAANPSAYASQSPVSSSSGSRCEGYQHHVTTVTYVRNTAVILARTGTNWCAFTERTGSAAGWQENTVVASYYNDDAGNYKYYAGPIKWSAKCSGRVMGRVDGNAAEFTKNYCVS